jgi:hypothetical protein
VSRRNKRVRVSFALAALALLAGVAVAIAAGRSGGGASASKFEEPSVSPSCAPSRLNVSAALAGARVTVSPEPDSRDASVATQISMLGPPASELTHVTVSGSRSGAHTGRLEPYSQGDGASFVPATPFAEGERVVVRAEVRNGASAQRLLDVFAIAELDRITKTPERIHPGRPSETQSFRSRPDLRPPALTVTASSPAVAPRPVR